MPLIAPICPFHYTQRRKTGMNKPQFNDMISNPRFDLSLQVKIGIIIAAFFIYFGAFYFLSDILKVSVNYFVLLPMFAAATLFKFFGGLVSGIIALPMNLLLLKLFGDLHYAPASPAAAEIFGTITGGVLGYLSGFYHRLRKEISEHHEAREMLDKMLTQKQLLLRESHHRIKNNLSIIMSIIELELMEEKDPRQEQFLENLVDRIRSVSITQNLLYSIEDISEIEMSSYLSKLIDQITLSLSIKQKNINFIFDMDKIVVDIDLALPIGLIINEACTNSIKYAFHDVPRPVITIKLKKQNPGYRLLIRDNGTGVPPAVLQSGSESVGLNLMQKLVLQINGTMSMRNDDGAVIEIIVPIKKEG